MNDKNLTPDEVAKASVDAVDKAASTSPDNLIQLSTGVVLTGKPANPIALITVMANFPRPKPPVYFDKSMGREMENPNDPDYIARVRSADMERSSATLNVMILMGTALKSLPKGFSGPDDDEWLEEYKLLGLPIFPENKRWRYLRWIIFRAAPDQKDITAIQDVVSKLSGVREEDVKNAETFPGSN